MKRNILYIHNKIDISGGERSLLNLWDNIDEDSFNLFLILPGKGVLSDKAVECGVTVLYSKAPKLTIKNIFKILGILFKWSAYILKYRIHLIHSYTPRNNILSGIIGRLFLRPVIWHERNLIYDDKLDVTRKFLYLPQNIICNSFAIAERFKIQGIIPDKVKVIYNGVDLDKYKMGIISETLMEKLVLNGRKVVGVVTNLSKRKRVEFFLRAAVQVRKEYSNVVFVVVGGSFPRNEYRMMELKELVFFLGIDKDVVFTGFQDDICGLISRFDISVNVTDKEACSRAIIESMACGKAVVAMNDGGSPELIQSGFNGILTDPLSISDFSNTVIALLKDDDRRISLGANARKTVENKFDVKKNAQKTQALYLSLIRSREGKKCL